MSMKDAFKKAGYQGGEKAEQKSSSSPPAQKTFCLEKNYAAQAEKVILQLKNSREFKFREFTTSKIRNILAKVSEIYNEVWVKQADTLSPEIQSRIEYLKVRLVYECGREPKVVKPFVEKAGLLELLNGIGGSRQNFIDFARYMEALVAYHRFHDGRD